MAKVQFNCRLDEEIAKWIADESERQSAEGKKFSQADVITLLVGSAAFRSPATTTDDIHERSGLVCASATSKEGQAIIQS